MDASLVQSKIAALAEKFKGSLGIAMWKESPLVAFGDINRAVTDSDGLKARLASLTAIFDFFNKDGFDAALGSKTKGTRVAFVNFLKLRFPDDQPSIESDIEAPMGLICLLRDYLLHTKSKNYQKALDYFRLSNPIDNPAHAWDCVLAAFAEWLDRLSSLIADSSRERCNNEALGAAPLQFLVDLTYSRHSDLLESMPTAAMLNEIIRLGHITDADLAATFGVPIADLRKLLYPLTGDVLIVTPIDRNTTRLAVSEPMIKAIQNSGSEPEDED